MVFAAIYQGILPDEPLMKKLARKQPSTLQDLMDKVEEQRPVKKFKDYNFTPLNVGILKVLMEIKKEIEVSPTTKDSR